MIVARLQVPECSPTETFTPWYSSPATRSMEMVRAARTAVPSQKYLTFGTLTHFQSPRATADN
jgi:hypothetical protein